MTEFIEALKQTIFDAIRQLRYDLTGGCSCCDEIRNNGFNFNKRKRNDIISDTNYIKRKINENNFVYPTVSINLVNGHILGICVDLF